MRSIFLAAATALVALIGLATPASAACDGSRSSRAAAKRYAINGETVYDKKTDLTWQRCSLGQRWRKGVGCVGIVETFTWDEAMRQAGGGWRIPTKDELATLVAPACSNPAINEAAFPDMDPGKFDYWTSTETGASTALGVNFADGSLDHDYYHAVSLAVRLVRTGQ